MVFLYAAYEGYNSHCAEVLLKQISWPLTRHLTYHRRVYAGEHAHEDSQGRAILIGMLKNWPVKNWPVI